ncbi:exosome complex exonuclease RRP46 homolog isoform X4 [Olea europaea var. sylvestris]|uniref:exosome complex exonuclease RRP46 homolog isoform X4 n=1 Tax=Olea europaea var. sylvestris TaxID=158386 RepID=UPI000C1D866D|nr:exosome complex exonuclease RRP46 homolog isoform X4 [Olea europaea var. sylvestris]
MKSTEEKGEDGRSATQLRPLSCTRSVLNRAHGSASFSQGETKILAAVYGPKAGTKKNENPEKACIEVIWKPKSGQIGKAEKEYEMILKRTLQNICILNVHPNTTTTIIIQVVNDDGSLLPCAINAACSALVDAGIPLKYLAVIFCSCHKFLSSRRRVLCIGSQQARRTVSGARTRRNQAAV